MKKKVSLNLVCTKHSICQLAIPHPQGMEFASFHPDGIDEGGCLYGMEGVPHFIQMEWVREDYCKRQFLHCLSCITIVCHHLSSGITSVLSIVSNRFSSLIVCHSPLSAIAPLSVIPPGLSFSIVCHYPLSSICPLSANSHCLSFCIVCYSPLPVIFHCLVFPIVCHSPLSFIPNCLSFSNVCHSP